MLRQFWHTLLPVIFASMLIMMPVTEAYAAPLAQQDVQSYQGIVNTTSNIRSGPGLNYEVVDQAQPGESIVVVGCNEDCSWFQLDNGSWIAAFLVNLVGTTEGTADSTSTTEENDNSTSTRPRNQIIDPDDLELSEPSQAALDIVAQILSYTGLPQSFELYSANIYNAAALMADGKRVILYDPQLIADIENITDHDWPAVSILAHEIGHHLAGHTLAREYNRDFELEADYFSGFILEKMGATLDEAQAVMNLLRDHPNMTDHPPQAERLAAIEEGWQQAASQDQFATWEPNYPSFSEEVGNNNQAIATPAEASSIITVLQKARSQRSLTVLPAQVSPLQDQMGIAALVE